MEAFDKVMQDLSELVATAKTQVVDGKPVATFDVEAAATKLKSIIDTQVELRLAEARAKSPDRRGEMLLAQEEIDPQALFAAVASGNANLAKEMSTKIKGGFGGRVRSGKFAGQRVEDLLFAKNFLERAHSLEPAHAKAPSGELTEVTKLLGATTVGAGDELVPTGMAAEIWADSFIESRVVQTLGVVPMPTDPFDFPVAWGALTWRKGGAGEATAAQNPSTARGTLTSTEQLVEVDWEYNLDEDAVIAMLPSLRSELSRSGSEQMDAFVLNADATATATGNINSDDGLPPADRYDLSNGQDGIRHLYLVDETGQSTDINTTLTDTLLRAGIGRLGKYGVRPDRTVMFVPAKVYLISLIGLTNVATVDKYGQFATVLTGELARYQGIPIIVSESMLLAEDDGKLSVTAALNDEGQIALVNRDSWKVGFRRQLLIEVARDIKKRVFVMVVSFRIAVGARNRTDPHTAGIHGIMFA